MIVKFPSFFAPVDDFPWSYLPCFAPHELHDDAGTQRSDEPVSKSTKNETGGVPMVMCPPHSSSSLRSVKGTFCRFSTPSSRRAKSAGSAASGGMVDTPAGSWPVFRWRFSRLLRYLLCEGMSCGQGKHEELCILGNLNAVLDCGDVVEGTVRFGEGAPLLEGDSCSRSVMRRARRG